MDNPQQFLEGIVDTNNFLQGVQGWNSHRPLLLLALELTKDCTDPVTELGSGDGSTEHLRNYCYQNDRPFLTYDSDNDWANKTGSIFVEDWDKILFGENSVVLLDLAPGHYRSIALARLKEGTHIICVHDSELGGAGDYRLEPTFDTFKYRLNYNQNGGGAGATLVSNVIDVSVFSGLNLGGFKFD